MASTLGRLIKAKRESTVDPLTGRPFTQAGLGQAVGLSRAAITALERGDILSVTPETANRLSKLLSVPVEALVAAMGFAVGTPDLSAAEAELVQLYRRVPELHRAGFVELARLTAQGLAALSDPAQGSRRRAG